MEQASTDPRRLFTAFRAGTIYHAAWDQFFHGRSLAGDVTEAEQRAVFEASDAAKLALIDYVRLEAPFGYDPASYATPAAAAIDTYIAHVQHIANGWRSESTGTRSWTWTGGDQHTIAVRRRR